MLRLEAYQIEKTGEGSASLAAGDGTKMQPIVEFGVIPYTEEEEHSPSEIVFTFNDRHGTTLSREDFLRLEQVSHEILEDEDLREKILKNPEDVVLPEFAKHFMGAMIQMFQRDTEMKSAVMATNEARDLAIRHFFRTARRQVIPRSTRSLRKAKRHRDQVPSHLQSRRHRSGGHPATGPSPLSALTFFSGSSRSYVLSAAPIKGSGG
jgi:hypothetical protein